MSKVPTTEQRFAGVIEQMTDTKPYGGVIGIIDAAKACREIHDATIQELLDDVELLIPSKHQQAFLTLKEQYATAA